MWSWLLDLGTRERSVREQQRRSALSWITWTVSSWRWHMQIFSIIKHIYIVFTIAVYIISNFSVYVLLLSKSEQIMFSPKFYIWGLMYKKHQNIFLLFLILKKISSILSILLFWWMLYLKSKWHVLKYRRPSHYYDWCSILWFVIIEI